MNLEQFCPRDVSAYL